MDHQNVVYYQTSAVAPRSQSSGQGPTVSYITNQGSTAEFHPTTSAGFTTNASTFHGGETTTATFLTNNGPGQSHHLTISRPSGATMQQPQRIAVAVPPGTTLNPSTVQVLQLPAGTPISSLGNGQQHILITTQPVASSASGTDERHAVPTTFMEGFFVEQPVVQATATGMQEQPIGTATQYDNQPLLAKYGVKSKLSAIDRAQREHVKRQKQAEAARQRYHRLNAEEKKTLNLKRTLAQKRKRQREREMAELEAILRQTGDIIDDPEVTEQLRERRMRARWAEAARTRYQRMSSEERRVHNTKRRMRQMTVKNDKGEVIRDEDAIRMKIKEQNAKKAEAARLRYHRMNPEEKKMYNQRRTEAFRRRRMEEEALLAMPIGRINGEALDRAQQIVIRNAKRAEAARLRYQRMTPEQRKNYNQKRYTPKRRHGGESGDGPRSRHDDEFDALSSLERDVLRRTQQAQQALIRQRQNAPANGPAPPMGAVTTGTVTVGTAIQQQQVTPAHIITSPGSAQTVHVQTIPAGAATGHIRQIQYATTSQAHIQPQQIITAYTNEHHAS